MFGKSKVTTSINKNIKAYMNKQEVAILEKMCNCSTDNTSLSDKRTVHFTCHSTLWLNDGTGMRTFQALLNNLNLVLKK